MPKPDLENPFINTDNRIVDIDLIFPNKYNPKLDFNSTNEGKKNYARTKKSLKVHGQLDPILVREVKGGFEIVNGFHRYTAAKELGWTKLEIKNLGKIKLQKGQIIALATEDTKIPLDRLSVAKLIKELLGFDISFQEELPYDEEDINKEIKLVDFDWDEFNKKPDEPGNDKPHDDSEGYKIILPNDRLEAWRELKQIKGAQSDTELIILMIDENMRVYADEIESKARRRNKKAKDGAENEENA